MTAMSTIRKVDTRDVASFLQKVRHEMEANKDELVLDFSGVLRLDTNALLGLEQIATYAELRKTRVVLHGVNESIYKVLTLVKLASRFSFVS